MTLLRSELFVIMSLAIREDKLWLFDSPESAETGTCIPLEKAVISDGALSRSSSSLSFCVDRGSEQLNIFEVPIFSHFGTLACSAMLGYVLPLIIIMIELSGSDSCGSSLQPSSQIKWRRQYVDPRMSTAHGQGD